jgi:hypothetical protein
MDMSKLTMDKEGRVFDVNGRVVGHITTPNAGRSDGLERGVSPPLVTSPPPNSSYQRAEVPQYSKRTQESSAVVEKSRKSADKAAARAAKAGLLASREADLAARRSKVENRIRSEHQGGRLSNEQMNELMSSLQSTIQTEQDFKRDKKLKDREMLFLYRKWDSIMGDVDDDLKKNARSAVGLRTR